MRTRLLVSSVIAVLLTAPLHAESGFVGRWKLVPDKSTMHDQMKVTAAGTNRYTFNFGGGPEMITADGTDQPGLQGSTLAVTQKAPRVWNVVRKQNGTLQISAIWTLADDGHSLRDDFTGYQKDGSHFTIHYIYTPLGVASGFAATWDSTTERPGAEELEVQTWEGNGLSFVNQTRHSTKQMKFDGRPYPVKDPNSPPAATSSARRLSANTLEFTEKTNGKLNDTQNIQLSNDGKTLTISVKAPYRIKPNVFVYERE